MNDVEITIQTDSISLNGILTQPPGSNSLVIFSHGSGSSRFSPRNRYVAGVLNKSGISTLLIDLLTEEEDTVFNNRFDISLLSARLISVTNYFLNEKHPKFRKTGYFGASTGAASALVAASKLNHCINAVVSRGGRPDLAGLVLPNVKSPTLLIVGELDEEVLALNEHAFGMLRCNKSIQIISGATHLFEEPGTLEQVAKISCNWFILNFNH